MSQLDNTDNLGANFLHKKYNTLHTSPAVEHEKARLKKKINTLLQKPDEKIDAWMDILQRTHESHREDPRVMERLKKFYHKKHVIAPEHIPESEFLLEQRIARNLGHGNVEITEEFKEKKTKEIISNQEQSLDKWIDYLTSPDAMYPTWAKYWAFTSLVKMGKLVKEEVENKDGSVSVRFRFTTRDKSTAAAFPPLNPRALALSISAIEEKVGKNAALKNGYTSLTNTSTKLSNEAFEKLVSTERFDQLYAQYLTELPQYSTERLKEIRGSWIKYSKDSDPKVLVDSLEGYPLEWCTANTETARTQLQGGDFYVYYSLNEEGNAEIPRLAIRMDEDSIGEVRGIAPDQNIDPYISPVMDEKMKEFPDGEKYKKKSENMRKLTEIEQKLKKIKELSIEELRFLYEIDEKIEGFGYEKDPRIEELLRGRDFIQDYNSIIKSLPQAFEGDLNLGRLTSAKGLILPQFVIGNLNLNGLTSTEGLILPQSVGGSLYLGSLTSAKGLTLPPSLGKNLNLNGLTSAEGLILPQSLGGSLILTGLTSAKGLTLPQFISGDLSLWSISSIEGLILPQSVDGVIYLRKLNAKEKTEIAYQYPNLKFQFK